tara:strand:- start:1957 stop:2520 length:564 start_codon:yes stop_codon:yes gene_type:complete
MNDGYNLSTKDAVKSMLKRVWITWQELRMFPLDYLVAFQRVYRATYRIKDKKSLMENAKKMLPFWDLFPDKCMLVNQRNSGEKKLYFVFTNFGVINCDEGGNDMITVLDILTQCEYVIGFEGKTFAHRIDRTWYTDDIIWTMDLWQNKEEKHPDYPDEDGGGRMDFGKDHIIDHEDGTDFMARVSTW